MIVAILKSQTSLRMSSAVMHIDENGVLQKLFHVSSEHYVDSDYFDVGDQFKLSLQSSFFVLIHTRLIPHRATESKKGVQEFNDSPIFTELE